ncbi:MAG TPA: hypothetical protein PLZ75_00785 [Bacteroidales bacterium]|jgi:hypothetical protein|nr:hypothetical protein [Bacteroidales bacterium]HQH23274.1 hypothetical protein [Bacteroidales bacterium]HQJ80868.1 hypothetical protein [Bacteroidales bacterium]
MKNTFKQLTRLTALLPVIFISGLKAESQKARTANQLNIKSIELNYPVPAIPFYHFRAEIELPQESIIEVEAAVDGKVLRATDIRRPSDLMNMNRPTIPIRPPSGYNLSHDGTLYKNFILTGWVRWETGKDYSVRISVRLKKNPDPSPGDIWLTATRTVSAPRGSAVFSSDWKNYKALILSETAGISRTGEAVEVLLAFYSDEAQQIERDIRVVAVDPQTYELTEVPSQVYDRMEYLREDDLDPDEKGKPTRQAELWLPTVTARVAFLADVPAKTSRVYLVFYNNPDAMGKVWTTDLRVQGEAPGLQIENSAISVILHPNSGHLDQITLKSRPDIPLYHRSETNGAMHWNPDIYVPPRPWTHTADWNPPKNVSSVAGSIIARSDVWDDMRKVPEVDASVRYEFFPGVPYFISSTSIRIKETVQALALRNAEMVIKRDLITHAAWYDIVRDSVIIYDVSEIPDFTDLKMEADVPWVMFFNKEKGVGFAGIQLSYSNTGVESPVRVLNPFFYITAGPWVYWARGLSHTFLSSNMQQVIPALKGNVFSERWAYLVFETDKSPDPFTPVTEWRKRLINPLRIDLVEEVDDRVTRIMTEALDDAKSE